MNRKKAFLLAVMFVTVLSVMTACKKQGGEVDVSATPGITGTGESVKPTLTAESDDDKKQDIGKEPDSSISDVSVESDDNGNDSAISGENTKVKPDDTANPPTDEIEEPTEGVDSQNTSEDDRTTESESNVGDAPDYGSNDDVTDISDTGSENSDAEREMQRSELWMNSFLVWIPELKDGNFVGNSAADTFDYAYFTDIDRNDVLKYIETLSAAGFSHNVETVDRNGKIEYSAQNDNLWCVQVKYSDKDDFFNGLASLEVSSGFWEDGEDAGDKLTELYSTTMLRYLPMFTSGYLDSHYPEDDGSAYYAVLAGVNDAEVREYIYGLMDAGYIYEVEEGDSDGIIWYSAMNEDELICDLVYSDGIVRIGCMN